VLLLLLLLLLLMLLLLLLLNLLLMLLMPPRGARDALPHSTEGGRARGRGNSLPVLLALLALRWRRGMRLAPAPRPASPPAAAATPPMAREASTRSGASRHPARAARRRRSAGGFSCRNIKKRGAFVMRARDDTARLVGRSLV